MSGPIEIRLALWTTKALPFALELKFLQAMFAGF